MSTRIDVHCKNLTNSGGVGAPRNFAQGMMVITASRVTFLPILNMAVPLKKRLQKIANISNTEVYTSLNLPYGLEEYLIFFI